MTKSKTFDEEAKRIANEIAQVVISKQHDYGKDNILYSPTGVYSGILVRLWDKMARLKNLYRKSKKDINFESVEDTYVDIAGYSILAIMVQRDAFDLPLENEKLKKKGK